MKISIIIPSYNSSRYIEETLDTIYAQKYKNLEVFLVDGNSTDNTIEIAEKYPLTQMISEKDRGQSDAINKGFKLVAGDIVAWQNADDTYEPSTFNIVTEFFTRNPKVGLLYGAYMEMDESSKKICTVETKTWSPTKFKLGRFCPVQPTVFWRKEVLDEVGFLDESLNFCMDVDFYSRVVKSKWQVKGIREILGSFRVHNESKTQNSANRKAHKAEYLKVLSSHFSYSVIDRIFFEFYHNRSRLASLIKRSLSI